ncbi:MAG: cytochrome c biogenesis protein [Planctomycetota bacterium]|jgi:ABC-type transport system involved in cytochrome c biogenesis permease subunit
MLRKGLILLAAVFAAPLANAQESRPELPVPTFSKATIDALAHIPVQNEGRVKPLYSYAAYTLLNLHHKRKFTLPDGRRIRPVEWWARTVLFPRRAGDDLLIRIDDSDLLDEIGLGSVKKKKRDLYSYNELRPGRRRLAEKYGQYIKIDRNKQTREQQALVNLAHKVFTFEQVRSFLAFAEVEVPLRTDEQKQQFGGKEAVPLSEALTKLQGIIASGEQPEWARGVAQMCDTLARQAGPLRIMAPLDTDKGLTEDWYAVGDIVGSVFANEPSAQANIEFLQKLEAFYAARGTSDGIEKASIALLEEGRARAESSKAYDKIELEVTYHRLDLFSYALYTFILAFLVLALSWFMPNSKWVRVTLWSLAIFGAGLVTYGITLRCILRGRPPVSTLYETIIFITGTAVISALVIEWINKRRIGIAIAVLLGVVGMFIAGKYEAIERRDTMPQLQAVLDTNFWLATHVTAITLGYAAGLLAAALAHVYVLGKAFRFKKNDPEFYRGVGRMVYGTIGFSLIFSVVGTILGGVWANDSWGRFWGWDPKENGALMIVLSQLAIIHARLGGYLKPFGISMAAIASGMIIAFSWWHVNLLGIGLHAYGRTEGVMDALTTFYTAESLVLIFAGGVWAYERWFAKPSVAA